MKWRGAKSWKCRDIFCHIIFTDSFKRIIIFGRVTCLFRRNLYRLMWGFTRILQSSLYVCCQSTCNHYVQIFGSKPILKPKLMNCLFGFCDWPHDRRLILGKFRDFYLYNKTQIKFGAQKTSIKWAHRFLICSQRMSSIHIKMRLCVWNSNPHRGALMRHQENDIQLTLETEQNCFLTTSVWGSLQLMTINMFLQTSQSWCHCIIQLRDV